MICTRLIFIDLGRCGSGIVRDILCSRLSLSWIDQVCHMTLSHNRDLQPTHLPSFTLVRSPFDWYIAYYMQDMGLHRWRGSFRDWLLNERTVVLWNRWSRFGCSDVDYVGRFETLLDDMVRILGAIIPDLVTAEQIREWFPASIGGIEQWMRDELYSTDMIELVYKRDAMLFEQFGYTFEERYYHLGGCGASHHEGRTVGNWESERSLTENWATWVGQK